MRGIREYVVEISCERMMWYCRFAGRRAPDDNCKHTSLKFEIYFSCILMNLRLSSVLRIHEETEWYINTNDTPHFSTYISGPFLS